MKFSIIVVALNAGEKLKNTVDSILGQSFGDFEIIIKDGLSTDGSLKLIPEDSRIRVFENRDLGIYDAMNQAIKHINGEYVQFLNCGDGYRDAQVLEKVAEYIDNIPQNERRVSHIFYGDTYNEQTKATESSPNEITDASCYRNIPCHQSCIYSAELFGERGYDINYTVRADYEHFLYCVYKKHAICRHIGITIADYEGGGFSDSPKNREKREAERRKIIEKYLSADKIKKLDCMMMLTLAPLRTRMNESRALSRVYNTVKSGIYRFTKG